MRKVDAIAPSANTIALVRPTPGRGRLCQTAERARVSGSRGDRRAFFGTHLRRGSNSPSDEEFLNDGLPGAGIHCAACACIWWTPLSCGGLGIGLDTGWWQRRVRGSWQWSHGDAPIGWPAAAVDSGPQYFGSVPFQPQRQLDVDVEDRVIHGDLTNVGLLCQSFAKTRSKLA